MPEHYRTPVDTQLLVVLREAYAYCASVDTTPHSRHAYSLRYVRQEIQDTCLSPTLMANLALMSCLQNAYA